MLIFDADRKTQTTKDLAKPWAQLPLQPRTSPSPSSTPPHSSSPSHSRSQSPPGSHRLPRTSASLTEVKQEHAHSAASTLLLDDSPAKARLQPYNHVCLREYDSALRNRDLRVLELERARPREADVMPSPISVASPPRAPQGDLAPPGESDVAVPSTNAEPGVADTPIASADPIGHDNEPDTPDAADPPASLQASKKRKRVGKKKKSSLATALQTGDEDEQFDETLLAVIGILDAIKLESNVAGWIRSGRLWGPDGPPSASFGQDGATADSEEEKVWEEWNGIQSDETKNEENGEDGNVAAAAKSDSDLSVDGQTDGKKSVKAPTKRMKPSPLSPVTSTAPPLVEEKVIDKLDEDTDNSPIPGLTGGVVLGSSFDGNVSKATPELVGSIKRATSEEIENELIGVQQVPQMWFERLATVQYWAKQGRRACEDLGIAVVHGVDR
jgi:hypothetical protein